MYNADKSWDYNFVVAVLENRIPHELAWRYFAESDGLVVNAVYEVVKHRKLDKIAAIKLHRSITNLGLAESKAAVERACFPTYRFADTGLQNVFWASEECAALCYIVASASDRLSKVGENQYKLLDSSSFATYIIPDRMVKLV